MQQGDFTVMTRRDAHGLPSIFDFSVQRTAVGSFVLNHLNCHEGSTFLDLHPNAGQIDIIISSIPLLDRYYI